MVTDIMEDDEVAVRQLSLMVVLKFVLNCELRDDLSLCFVTST